MNTVATILHRALNQQPPAADEVALLLRLTEDEERQALLRTARTLRARVYGNRVGLYGFVYFSTHCRNDCSFCLYRRSNLRHARYRKDPQEVLAAATALADSGVHLIDLTMGEDPWYLNRGEAGFAELVELVRQVKRQTGLPVMISPGVVPDTVLRALSQAGADWYACYQETHNRALFTDLRLGQDYDRRWHAKRFAQAQGMLVEEGLLVGAGDRVEDAVGSLAAMQVLEADQVRAMTFVPQAGTPLAAMPRLGSTYETNLIAVMRLLFPHACIPASLDVDGIQGLKDRLNAGANVVTSIIPPAAGLQGVSQSTLDINEGFRTVDGVRPILADCGLEAATAQAYQQWLQRLRRHHTSCPQEVAA